MYRKVKRIMSAVLAAIILCCAFSVGTSALDVDYTVNDVSQIQMYVARLIPDIDVQRYDIDKNGVINTNDASLVQMIIAKLYTQEQPATTAPVTTPTDVLTTQCTSAASTVDDTQISTDITPPPSTDGQDFTEPTATEPTTSVQTTTEPSTGYVQVTSRPGESTEPTTAQPITSAPLTEPTETVQPTTRMPVTIAFASYSENLGIGETYELFADLSEENADTSWYSSNTAVATVEKVANSLGVITAKSKGTAVITAQTCTGETAKFTVDVKRQSTKLELNETYVNMGLGETVDLNSYNVDPDSYAYHRDYYSSNPEVATVTKAYGIVEAKSIGTTEITCVMSNGIYATCVINVKKQSENIYLNADRVTLGVGEGFDLNSSIDSGTAAYHRDYYSDNPDVAEVTVEYGLVTAKAPGTANIRCVMTNGKYTVCTITVLEAPKTVKFDNPPTYIRVNDVYSITGYANSGAWCSDYTFTTTDSTIISVRKTGAASCVIKAHKSGHATIYMTAQNGVSASVRITVVLPDSFYIDGVPYINQDNLPTGCETCSAVMLMQYYGYDITETKFARDYLICRPFYATDNYYGPDPNSAFVGSPFNSYSFGVFSPALAKSMNNYLYNTPYEAKSIKGESLAYYLEYYVVHSKPVLIWATMNMAPSYKSTSWIVDYTDENAEYSKGSVFTWSANEHCLVLTGFDPDYYYFNDPWNNNGRVRYKRSLVEQRYRELSMQAVVID